ncbi:hypothetical protein CHS0354_031301 [Potamilus streckersoni]|uniref:Uncharacterized protein n=1 Tax=Potamilus streckersoni TaxID=2493646 RepID=A0AAE0WBZ6_9BIVA|nr:hypothetical protein CHS0354_031301 [Potamilus streckersoni]
MSIFLMQSSSKYCVTPQALPQINRILLFRPTLRSGQTETWIKNEATGHCYQIVDRPTRWPQAFNICRNDGGMLAVIESAEEQLFIQGQIQSKSFKLEGLWLGADTLHPVEQRTWINGENFSYTNWAPNQPDNRASEENCAEIYAQTLNGLWNDLPCTYLIGYICENTRPHQPTVTFLPNGTQSIYINLTQKQGLPIRYQIIWIADSGDEISDQNDTFSTSENITMHNFTTTDQPGTCFNFTVHAISGSGEGACTSDATMTDAVCFAPSKPHVVLVTTGTNSIRVTITIVHGLATSYEIIVTPVIEGNETINNGTFPQNLNTSVYIFTSDNEPGTCFNFRITAISGYGTGAGRSEPVAASGICFNPSKPMVTFIPESIQSIQVTITMGNGQATSYEIIGTPISGSDVSIQNGIFPFNETSVIHNFTTSDLPGTCFNFQFIAISGTGKGAGRSEPMVIKDVCYVTGPISRPVVQPEIERQATGRSQLVFYCEFEPSSDPTVLYTVMWYRDQIDAGYLLTSSKQLQYSSRETFRSMTLLTERYITLGITIKPDDDISIQDSEEATIYIQSTIPFSCLDINEECVLNVNMFYRETEAEKCFVPAAAAFLYCGVRISSRRWNETYNLRIGIKHGQDLLSISRPYKIKFRTHENFGHHEMFRNYTIPVEIQVTVSTDASNLNGKECHAISDPHMLTFDGRYYENQNNGTYILYKHATKPVQVQMKTNLCYDIPQGPPFCPCGVVIAAGRDVFVIDRCSIPIKIYMPRCDDGTLKGKVKSHGKLYQIYLPTGSLVKINAGVSFNIYLYPSVSDRRATSGLCGYLDNDKQNDFTLRNGSSVPENEFEAFNSNWEVNPEENLFNTSNYKFLPTWPKANNMCICGQYQGGHIDQSDKCSPDSRKFCPDNSLIDSLAAMCNELLTDDPGAAVEVDQNDQNDSRSKINTMTENHSMRNYTENSASIECWSFLNSSKLFQKCSEIPDIDPSSFASTCAKDAIITSTMNWASTHLDSAQKSCLYQVIVNQPLPNHLLEELNATVNQTTGVGSSNQTRKGTYRYTADFKNEVEQLACPMDCSGHGNCSKGKCVCEGSFGDVDCSVDLRVPPMVYGIPERGVCDLQRKECENVSVLGDNFVESGKLSCRLTLFKIKLNGTILQDPTPTIDEGRKISFAEVTCKIRDVRSKRSVQFSDDLDTAAIVYGVAVSNNRKNFSQESSLLLYDSLCLDCMKAGFNIACKIKEGFYLENRKCIKKAIPSTSSDLVLIISTVMGSALILLVGLTIACCVIQRKKRKRYQKEKKEKQYQELQEMERNKEYFGISEEVYDQIKDGPDTYCTIHDNPLTTNESTEREERYVKIGTTDNSEIDGYSSLSKDLQDECISDGGKPDIPYRPTTLPKVTTVTDVNPI